MAGTKIVGRGAWVLLGWHRWRWAGRRPARADEPAKELTEEERGQLEKEAGELNDQAVQLYRDGKYAAATDMMEKVLDMDNASTRPRSTPTATPTWPRVSVTSAPCCEERGEYGKAEPYYRDALA